MTDSNHDFIPAGISKPKTDLRLSKLVFFRSNFVRKGDYFPLSDVLLLASQAMLFNIDFGIYEKDGGELWLEYDAKIRDCKGEREVFDMIQRHAQLLQEFTKTIVPA